MLVRRPVVRSFAAESAREAAAHARAGGHSVYWSAPRRPLLVVPRVREDDPMDLGLWSICCLRHRYRDETKGVFAGLSLTIVPRSRLRTVRHQIRRDSVLDPPIHEMELECLACSACCRDNRVILTAQDVRRFETAGRPELARQPHARCREDQLVVTHTRGRRCRHLEGFRCGIYAIRPEACREFPPGSESCLAARAERGLPVVPDRSRQDLGKIAGDLHSAGTGAPERYPEDLLVAG